MGRNRCLCLFLPIFPLSDAGARVRRRKKERKREKRTREIKAAALVGLDDGPSGLGAKTDESDALVRKAIVAPVAKDAAAPWSAFFFFLSRSPLSVFVSRPVSVAHVLIVSVPSLFFGCLIIAVCLDCF